MSHTNGKGISTRSFAAIGAFSIVSILGCAQAINTSGAQGNNATLSAAGSLLGNAREGARSLYETETFSLALDRIDQRDLPLDRTYRRTGTGKGVSVYVFDGGILNTHPELIGRVRKGYDAFPSDPDVCNAHGTAVAGAIAGRTLGVAPEAEIVDVKMVECSRLRGTIKAIVDGARWVIEDARKHGRPSIANWSFIADTVSRIPALDSAVAALRANGIAVVVSAGNLDINACRVSPGNAGGTIVVGATAITRAAGSATVVDRRAQNTAYGACIDIWAPGDSVLLPSFDLAKTPSVQLWNGTSMSTGYVSGAVALYFQSSPWATPDEALEHLKATATQNVIADSGSPLASLLYVGPQRDRNPGVAQIRTAQTRR